MQPSFGATAAVAQVREKGKEFPMHYVLTFWRPKHTQVAV